MSQITKEEIRKKLGNISQLQDLLFGDRVKEYDLKLRKQAQAIKDLESKQTSFQLLIEKKIERLENQLMLKIDSVSDKLEKRLKYIDITNKEERAKIQQNIDSISKYSYESIDSLQDSLKIQSDDLKTEISQSKASLERDLQLLKQQLMERLESSLSQLSTGKVSRNDLAEVMFELCLKFKEPDTKLRLSEASDNEKVVDLILPQQNSVEN